MPIHPKKPLEMILCEADLVSPFQLQVALRDRCLYDNLGMAEILTLRGWIKPETTDFFTDKWDKLLKSGAEQPLGYYLKAAGLLDEPQIQSILQEQKQLGIRFGAVAVLKGWLKQTTVDFFLSYLSPEEKAASPFGPKKVKSRETHPQNPANSAKSPASLTEMKFDLADALDIDISWLN